MGVKDHALAKTLETQRGRQQFRIVDMIQIGIKREGTIHHAPRCPHHAAKPAARLAYIKNIHPIPASIPLPIRHDQRSGIASGGEAPRHLEEYARVIARVGGGEVGNLSHAQNLHQTQMQQISC